MALSLPLILKGTPDIESYMLSIFSTMAFVGNLQAGTDPWFAPAYGFGVPLPTSTWFIRFPLAVPAAFGGADWLYGALWIGGQSLFGVYFLRLAFSLTGRAAVSVVLLVTALLSFSNLGPTYVDDWTENYFGWALLPACLWYVGRTLLAETRRERLKAGAACAFALGMFTGNAHHNEMVTLFSGGAVILLFLLPFRPLGVVTVGAAAVVALAAGADVLVPAIGGMLAGDVNPLDGPIATIADAPTLQSYGSFLEPWRAYRRGGLEAAASPVYERVPFFGAIALVLAVAGAVRPFASRQPVGMVPNDLARALGVGFFTYSALTLLPSWVVLNLPRMWTYRDGQTVLGLLCAAIAIHAMGTRFRWPLRAALAVHLAQIAIVAAPIVDGVLDGDARLFAYERRERILFDRLRDAGVRADGRVLLAGDLEDLVRGSLSAAGVTATTDFALEGIPIVNAWYRGGATPALGEALLDGRYGAYETIISWQRNLLYLDGDALDVLGITHVAALAGEVPSLAIAQDLAAAGAFELPGGRVIHVLRNEDAWSRAALLRPGTPLDPPMRPACPSRTIYCRDFSMLRTRLQARLQTDSRGSSVRATLPPGHSGGPVLVTIAAGRHPVAEVDGERRPVQVVLGTFAAVETKPGDRTLTLSVRPTGRIALTLAGGALLLAALVVAALPARRLPRGSDRPPETGNRSGS